MEKTDISLAERERIHGIKNKIQEALLILETCLFLDQSKLKERLKLLQAKLMETKDEIVRLNGRKTGQEEKTKDSCFNPVHILSDIFSPSNRQIRIEVQEGIFRSVVRGSPEDFRTIMENLILNAFEAGAANISIRVFLEEGSETGKLKVTVTDDGKSIKSEDLPFIFLPGYSTKKKGMGVGLYQVWKAVVRNGWEIRVIPHETGTKFVLSLPLRFSQDMGFPHKSLSFMR